jgi:hypothetical protein
MPVPFTSRNEKDHPWRGYVLRMFVGYDSFAAQNVEKLFMVVNMHLSPRARGKGNDRGLEFLGPKLLIE